MSTLFVALLLISNVIAICIILSTLDKRQKQKAKMLVALKFGTEAVRHNLSISSQEFFDGLAIGLDGLQQKLLVLTGHNEPNFRSTVFSLSQVRSCFVEKVFATASVPGSHRPDQYLQRVELRLDAGTGGTPHSFAFYDHIAHSAAMAPELEARARYWEAVVGQMNGKGVNL